MRCRPKAVKRENKYPHQKERKQKECLCVVLLVIIRSDPLLNGERGVYIPGWVVGENEDNKDSARSLNRNCFGSFR